MGPHLSARMNPQLASCYSGFQRQVHWSLVIVCSMSSFKTQMFRFVCLIKVQSILIELNFFLVMWACMQLINCLVKRCDGSRDIIFILWGIQFFRRAQQLTSHDDAQADHKIAGHPTHKQEEEIHLTCLVMYTHQSAILGAYQALMLMELVISGEMADVLTSLLV